MKYKIFGDRAIVILEKDDEIIEALKRFAEETNFYGTFIGIGALKNPVIGYYDYERKSYVKKNFFGSFEVVSLIGNITTDEAGNIMVHAHIAVADTSQNVWGGHLFSGYVSVTMEIIVFKHERLIRTEHKELKLKLIKL